MSDVKVQKFILGSEIQNVAACNCQVMKKSGEGYFPAITITLTDDTGVEWQGMIPVFTLRQKISNDISFS
jgi:hypothetical protein